MGRQIKICGLSRMEDIEAVNAARPDYAGFILNVPASRRSIDEKTLRKLAAALDQQILRVGVYVDENLEEMIRLLDDGVLDMIQLHGNQDEALIGQLQPHGPVIRAFQIHEAGDLAKAAASPADLVLLDAGAGGGRPFDWTLLQGFARPYLLAGGIDADNLEKALASGCMGVDISSGAESGGCKDPAKIMALTQAVKAEKSSQAALPAKGSPSPAKA